MNSLNILSARVIGPTPPQTPHHDDTTRENEKSENSPRLSSESRAAQQVPPSHSYAEKSATESITGLEDEGGYDQGGDTPSDGDDEKSPLLPKEDDHSYHSLKPSGWTTIPKRLADALIESIKWVLSTLAAPGVYIVGCLYDDRGTFSPLLPVRKVGRIFPRRSGRNSTAQAVGISAAGKRSKRPKSFRSSSSSSGESSSAIVNSESELEHEEPLSSSEVNEEETSFRSARSNSNSSASSEGTSPARRSIRIKLYNEDGRKQRRNRKPSPKGFSNGPNESQDHSRSGNSTSLTPATIKSPTSPASSLKMTRYPRAPAPPRPLVPRRQPSYVFHNSPPANIPQKTLILDLDETLIHSLAKGGRMSTGHMVEVKLNAPVGFGGGVAIAPQHPILYYVHKRPYCDDFLRKVSKWYNLVIFTASVQEYADPVIDWLEQDRKYFSGRYYRQHCTFRGGNYIKDISSVEPDLSKVMIVDNSPSSYVFHEDNALPIEGWISDPTDYDLLHLVPILEALQHVTDVRALLALRMGEVMSPSSTSPTTLNPTATA
ncbi:MAG: Nuclear envelope morphology protein 1 [Sclerophora amabilis]|nr:MAG: Nuclear envelope morphology protein 1 [Sclerophora amabilis]